MESHGSMSAGTQLSAGTNTSHGTHMSPGTPMSDGTHTSHGTHLQTETILQIVTEAEQTLWNQVGLVDSPLHEASDLGSVILQHGAFTEHIHKHFMRFEQRKCCLRLSACKQRFASVRLVRNDDRDNGMEDEVNMRGRTVGRNNVSSLDSIEFQVFQSALKCAEFPAMGSPDPPAVHTPTIGEPRFIRQDSKSSQSEQFHLTKRSVTLSLLRNNGRTKQDDISMVPAETLCELLMRVFRLSVETFNNYVEAIARNMEKKSPQRILAEELVRQLIALENNNNPFYNPRTFQNRLDYDQWQQRERSQITELLSKFWHFSLPNLADRTVQMKMMHDQYRLLMEKMIQYESQYRDDQSSPHPVSLLSSASSRLLREFGLRYGVGEQFRKIVYFNYLSVNFDHSLWFVQHVIVTLTSLMEVMPAKRSILVIVKEELDLLESSLHLLKLKLTTAVSKMKTLYPTPRSSKDIDLVIDLLSLTLQSQTYLLMLPVKSLASVLSETIQSIFPTTYERHKMVAIDELRQNKWETELSPKLLNMLMGNMREEVQDYKLNYQATFQNYFNITIEAAQAFYQLLMLDVTALHRQTMQAGQSNTSINMLLLSLSYRLNQLDSDWADYITPQMQTWRLVFCQQAQHWASSLKTDMKRFISQTVSIDKYLSCEVDWPTMVQMHRDMHPLQTTPGPRITPSMNSAFTSLASTHSTQDKGQSSREPAAALIDIPAQQRDVSGEADNISAARLSMAQPTSQSLFEKRPSSDPVNIGHGSLMGDTYLGDMARSMGHYEGVDLLTFTHIRHSSSLPNMHAHVTLQDKKKLVKGLKIQDDSSLMAAETDKSKLFMNSGHHSPEVESILSSDAADRDSLNETNDTPTITDDSLSLDGECNYPPLEEVTSPSTPVPFTDFLPVTVMSDMSGNSLASTPMRLVTCKAESQQSSINRQLSITKDNPSGFKTVPKQSNTFNKDKREEQGRTVPANNFGRRPVGENLLESFTDSLLSTVSFSEAREQRATLPVSSSVLDVMVMLQRLVGFGKSVCQTLFPQQTSYDSDQMSSGLSSVEMRHLYPPGLCKEQQLLYECFLRALRQTVCVYGDNMLCMDLCGTTSYTASRLAGTRLIEYLQTQQKSGLVWGCRHNLPTSNNKHCFLYLDRNTPLLCDRHEPITQEMCTRINNVSAIITCLEWYHRRLAIAFNIISDLTIQNRNPAENSSNISESQSDFVMLDSYRYIPGLDSSEVMETVSQILPTQYQDTGNCLVVTSPVEPDCDHLLAELRALCRIMAYRLNLFVCDALPVLLSLKLSDVSIEVTLRPITKFLSDYIHMLKDWLYKDNNRRVLECLWIFIVQDFELELRRLDKSEEDAEEKGQLLVQALSHLLKFMNSQDESLSRELLLSQAEDVSFRLSLHAMPSTQLITLFNNLRANQRSTSDVSSVNTQYDCLLTVRQRLKHDLLYKTKAVSGLELVTWILNNQELFTNFDPLFAANNQPYNQNTAYQIAQQLLHWGVIANVEASIHDYRLRSSPTESLEYYEFPDLTIHAQMARDSFTPISDFNATLQTPRATPKPGLKASLRAASRQSRPNLTSSSGKQYERTWYQRSVGTSQGPAGKDKTGADTTDSGVSSCSGVQHTVHQGSTDGSTDPGLETSLNSIGPALISSTDERSTDFDPYLNRGTPYSVSSGMSCESQGTVFEDNKDTFYYICPHVGQELETDQNKLELYKLVEECFQKKVTTEYLAKIVYSRRKVDNAAREFTRHLPGSLVERIKHGMSDSELPTCVSS